MTRESSETPIRADCCTSATSVCCLVSLLEATTSGSAGRVAAILEPATDQAAAIGRVVGEHAAALTQLAAGWQIGKKTFLTFSAGFCPDFSQLRGRTLGASLEFRFSREWRLQTSVEPTLQSCRRDFGIQISNPYQIGSDIRWEREF